MNIFLVLAALYVVANFYVFVGLFVEFWMYKTESDSFELKRYHILELIICPISFIKFIFGTISNFFKVIGKWLDEPFINREKFKEKI